MIIPTLLLVGLTTATALNGSDFVMGFGAVFKKTGTALFVLDDDGSIEIELNIISIHVPLTRIIVSLNECGRSLQQIYNNQACRETFNMHEKLKELSQTAIGENSSLNNDFLGALVDQRIVVNDGKKHYNSMNITSNKILEYMILKLIDDAENIVSSLPTSRHQCGSLVKPLRDIMSLYTYSLNTIQSIIFFFKINFSSFQNTGKISPELVNEPELLRFLSESRIYDNKFTIMPYGTKTVKHYYHLSKATNIRIYNGNNRYVYFKLHIPVKADIKFYDVYQIIPLYMSQGSTGFGIKLPRTQCNYIAVSRDGLRITFINDFKADCTGVPNNGYSLCPVRYVFSNHMNKNCISGSFLKNKYFHENCNILTSETFTPQFVNVDYNRWVFSFRDKNEMFLSQICRDPKSQAETMNGSVRILPGVGLFSFKKKCYGNGQLGTDHYTFKTSDSLVYGNEFKYLMFEISSINVKSNHPNIETVLFSIVLALNTLIMAGLLIVWIKRKTPYSRTPTPPPPSPSPPPLPPPPPFLFQPISSNSSPREREVFCPIYEDVDGSSYVNMRR